MFFPGFLCAAFMLLVNHSALNVFNLVLYAIGRLKLNCMLVVLVFP